ncbi:hypothetical protein KIN20_033985, partial [Parelaphostrongylus tenuis]
MELSREETRLLLHFHYKVADRVSEAKRCRSDGAAATRDARLGLRPAAVNEQLLQGALLTRDTRLFEAVKTGRNLESMIYILMALLSTYSNSLSLAAAAGEGLVLLCKAQWNTAMKISSALVDVIMDLVSLKDRNTKQLEAEKARLRRSSGTREILDVLTRKRDEIEERTNDALQKVDKIFWSVFHRRFRDHHVQTRSICIAELGNWMRIYPQHFLKDTYLEYISSSLYDEVPGVQLIGLSALLPLYGKRDPLGRLKLFSDKYRRKFVDMIFDEYTEVAVRACQLMTSIYRHRERGSRVSLSDRSRNSVNAELIQDLIQFYKEQEGCDQATYLVDALIDTNPFIKDWQTMVNLLLSDDVESSESQLIEILVCSVRQAATGESPVGRSAVRRGALSNEESCTFVENRNRVSEILIPTLPKLLHKFIADPVKITNLIELPLYFQLDMYMDGRLVNRFTELMKVIKKVLEKHNSYKLADIVAELNKYFSTNTSVAQQRDRFRLIDGLALKIRHSVERCISDEQWDEDDQKVFSAASREITAFASHIEKNKCDIWDVVLDVIKNRDDWEPLDVIEKFMWFLYMQLHSRLIYLVESQAPNEIEAVKKIKKRPDEYIFEVNVRFIQDATGAQLALNCFCDALILFNEELMTHCASVKPLAIRIEN